MLSAGGLVLGVAFGCSGTEEKIENGESPCVNGPGYPKGTTFPVIDTTWAPSEVTCTPQCGTHPDGILRPDLFTTASLPNGACDDRKAKTCTAQVEYECACPEKTPGPVGRYVCRCKGSKWECGVLEANLPCACAVPDAAARD